MQPNKIYWHVWFDPNANQYKLRDSVSDRLEGIAVMVNFDMALQYVMTLNKKTNIDSLYSRWTMNARS